MTELSRQLTIDEVIGELQAMVRDLLPYSLR
jgi:hypothetical protein